MMTQLEFAAPARYAARCLVREPESPLTSISSRARRPGSALRGAHGAELGYVFGTVRPAADAGLSAVMMRYWARFAATGDPNAARDSRSGPRYEAASDRLLVLDDPVR